MKWLIKRILQAVLTVLTVISISFVLIREMPGGPMDYVRAQLIRSQRGSMSRERLETLTETYTNIQPNEPIHIQYVEYMKAMLQGDFGRSTRYSEPVMDILAGALPWTIFIMSLSLLLTYLLGIALGALMAYKEQSNFDTGSTLGSILLNSIPYYVAAIILVYVLGYQFSLFPTGGRMNQSTTVGFNIPFIIGALEHAALPVASMVITGFGGQALSMRGNSIQVLGEDYLRVARLRGLSEPRIAFRYVARNAILPMYTNLMISIGFMISGSVILEKIFNYPGIGYYLLQAVNARDYALMMGAFVLITITVVIGIFVADLTYGLLDPRAKGGETREAY